MRFKRINPEADIRMETVAIADAYHLVWDAANMALGNKSPSQNVNNIMAEKIGTSFAKLDKLQADGNLITQAFSDGEIPKITLGTLLSDLDKDEREIYDGYTQISDQPINPFLVHDDRLTAIIGLSLCIEAAYNAK